MNAKNLTPEERLLKLIKEGAKPEKDASSTEHIAEKKADVSLPKASIGDRQNQRTEPPFESKPEKSLLVKAHFKNFLTVTNINKILFILFLLVLVFVLYNLAVFVMPNMTNMSGSKNNINLPVAEKNEQVNKENQQQGVESKPIDYYLQDITKRDLFKSVIAEKSGVVSSSSVQSARAKLEEAVKILSLKGIIAGDKLQAVIEDTSVGKTYFVAKGENIRDFIIEDITQAKVKIKFEDQSIDLTL